jgi:hypothetical protein
LFANNATNSIADLDFIIMNSTYHRVLWRQVWGLAALLTAILFSWMAYGFYQPVLLTKLGFIELAQNLGIIQGFLGAIIEPIVGAMSDRWMHRVGSRLPIISVGVTLAGSLFVIIGLLLHGEIPLDLRWIIPVLMTFWVISMIIFRGPAIALLRQFSPTVALPAANSVLTIVFGLVGAIGPVFGLIIKILGAANTFLFGAVMLAVGMVILQSSNPNSMVNPEISSSNSIVIEIDSRTQSSSRQSIKYLQIFGVGLGSGFIVNILLRVCPQKLHETLPNISPEYIAAVILLICAVAAIPLQRQIKDWELDRSMAIGLLSIVITIGINSICNFSLISIAIVFE